MAGKVGLLANRIFVFFNVIIAIIFLLACLASYLNPEQWWYISILGLAFPIILVLQIFFVFFWLVFKPKFSLISIITLLIGWKSISVFFAFHGSHPPFDEAKPKQTLRIATWNVARFVEWRRNNNKGSHMRLQMMDQIKAQNADVLCMQEFFTATDTAYYNNLKYIKENLGYPYHYFANDNDGGGQWFGQIIFSKHPIIDSGVIRYPSPAQRESLIHADIVFNHDTIRVYTTHLQSVRFKKDDMETIQKIKQRTEDSLLQNSRNIFSKLKAGFINRSRQVRIVRKLLDDSPHPLIICGDFNDVPNSYTYFTVRGNLQDAFLKKGFGIGRTFSGISPTLRIDYILAAPQFNVQQFNRIVRNLSDHYMLVADVQL
jgi:endonuclease/exonuclease/phosphatase family metal-dependent hydrolase